MQDVMTKLDQANLGHIPAQVGNNSHLIAAVVQLSQRGDGVIEDHKLFGHQGSHLPDSSGHVQANREASVAQDHLLVAGKEFQTLFICT